jgi:type I restriction-modification system DNA methylase subunit
MVAMGMSFRWRGSAHQDPERGQRRGGGGDLRLGCARGPDEFVAVDERRAAQDGHRRGIGVGRIGLAPEDPGGVLAAVRGGGAEGRIRQALVEENLLDAVIGLPANLFTTTGIPVAILIFDRSREEGGVNAARRDVLFIDASRDFTPGKTQNVMDDAHVAKVLETYANRAEVARYSHRAAPEEIAENGYNLNIPRYVDTFEPEEDIDVAAVQRDIARIEAELAEVRARMAGYLRELGVET